MRNYLETYQVVVLSTAHLTQSGRKELDKRGHTPTDGMVFVREEGFFIKLYEFNSDNEKNVRDENLQFVLRWALKQEFRMIQFDRDGPICDALPEFNW